MEIYCVKEVEQNPVPKSQTKPFYIRTKEAPQWLRSNTIAMLAIKSVESPDIYITKLDHLGSMNGLCYIQNRAVTNHVIKRFRCT